ncbi:MAG: hypothetical protein AAGJ18_06845 [Bacteroidota bacterium]
MQFYENQLFHIYNQGNNQRQTFFTDEHRKFFLWKMRIYLLPFGDLIAWCLMSNHFHWQFYVRKVAMERKKLWELVDKVEWQRRVKKYGNKAQAVKRDWSRLKGANKTIDLNESIGILQRSYSRAINKEKGWSGSLFKEPCQAKDGWIDEFVTVTKNGKDDYRFMPGNDYGFRCFNYVHDNAVEAKIVKKAIDYEWSSAKDYAGLRNGTLCNLEMGRQLRDFV